MPKQGANITLGDKRRRLPAILYVLILLSLAACNVMIGTIEVGVETEGDASPLEATTTLAIVNDPSITGQQVPTSASPTDAPDPAADAPQQGRDFLSGLVYLQNDFLWKIGADGEAAPFFDQTHHPKLVALSSDGLKAVFPGEGGLWIADIRSGERRQLTDNPDRFHYDPQWWVGNPGAILLLSKPQSAEAPPQPTGPSHLTLINEDGSDYQVLESEFETIVQPSPSPDGRTIAYVRGDVSAYDGGPTSPWLYRLDSGPEPFDYVAYGLPEFGDLSFGTPAFSPDGRYLAWGIGGDLSGEGTWHVGIALFDLESREAEVRFAYTPGDDIIDGGGAHRQEAPGWSGDNRWLTWGGFPAGSEPGTWIIPREGGEIQFVENAFTARWSPDSRSVAFWFMQEPTQIRVMDMASGEIRDIGIPPGTMLVGWVSEPFGPAANFPEGVWTASGLSAPVDDELLVQRNDRLGPEEVPTYMEIFWDYSPTSGRLAYSSQFYHFSEDNGTSVTDLWVYDYKTGQAEQWLDDNLSWASWRAPEEGGTGSDRLTAALYDPERGHFFLAFVDGPGEIEVITECASTSYSWSPDNKELAYVNKANWEGVSEACTGTFIYSAQDGSNRKVSNLGDEKLLSGSFDDAPIWSVEDGVLFYPDQPFWVIPLDGSPPFVPQAADGEEPMNLPRLNQQLWAPEYNLLIGNVEAMMDDFSGVWVYKLSDDLRTIVDRYRLEDVSDLSQAYRLIGWWEPGESLLILTEPSEFSWWGIPVVWSLAEQEMEILR